MILCVTAKFLSRNILEKRSMLPGSARLTSSLQIGGTLLHFFFEFTVALIYNSGGPPTSTNGSQVRMFHMQQSIAWSLIRISKRSNMAIKMSHISPFLKATIIYGSYSYPRNSHLDYNGYQTSNTIMHSCFTTAIFQSPWLKSLQSFGLTELLHYLFNFYNSYQKQ